MSLIHYLFLAHFEHDGETVRFAKSARDPVYRPVVRRPIDAEAIKAVLREMNGRIDGVVLPEEWLIWLRDGYLVCEKYTRNPEAINFIARLVERTHCDIHDVSAHCDMTLGDWLAMARSYAMP